MSTPKLLIIALTVALVGCASEPPSKEDRYENSIIPRSEKTMKDVYDSAGGAGSSRSEAKFTENVVRRKATWEELSVDPYTLNNTVRTEFRKLDNPTLYIYYPPTLTKEDRLPRPGWMTEFKMYDQDEFALPGEVNMERY